jgi:hypothetical protein
MKSENTGTVISEIEVLNVSPRGFWLYVNEHEYFLAFKDFPWFQDATVTPSSAVKKVVFLISNDLRQISAVFLHYILHRF